MLRAINFAVYRQRFPVDFGGLGKFALRVIGLADMELRLVGELRFWEGLEELLEAADRERPLAGGVIGERSASFGVR